MDIKVVAFDCDGVLFDTEKANMAYYNEVLKNFNKPGMTKRQFSYTHMHTVDESIAYLFEEKSLRAAAHTFRKSMSYMPFIKYMKIEPGLKPLLSELRPDYKIAIATNRTDTMDRVLMEYGLEGLFDLVVTAFDVKHPKPDPEPLNKILTHFEIKAHQAIYIGDSKLDELAADAAEIPFVSYDNTSLNAAFHIKSLVEIKTILKN